MSKSESGAARTRGQEATPPAREGGREGTPPGRDRLTDFFRVTLAALTAATRAVPDPPLWGGGSGHLGSIY